MPYISIGTDYGTTTQVSSVKQRYLGFKKLTGQPFQCHTEEKNTNAVAHLT